MTNDLEGQLIQAAKQSDQQAIAELYRLHVQAVYHYVQARVNHDSIAEDITSEVFVRAIETIHQYERRGAPFLGWLYHIAHGKIVNYYRYSERRSGNQNLDDLELAAPDDTPEQAFIEENQRSQLLRYLSKLTEEQQQVIILRFIQEYSLAETAKLMGKNEGAIKSLQFRALQMLAARFSEEEASHE